jgi:hypothetical protein
MKTRILLPICLSLAVTGCLVGRSVSNLDHLPYATVSEGGFQYVARGIEVKYEVRGLYPAKLNRTEASGQLEIAIQAYEKLAQKAGQLAPNQAFVNVVAEATFVRSSENELFAVVSIYADKIEYRNGRPRGAAEERSDAIALIHESIARAMPQG